MDVPDPRPAHQVVDLTGTLTADDIAAIDASALRGATNGELLVVVVPSTDGANPRQWTTALFNRLRLDPTPRNRGVVLMAAINDRKAEIVVGEGYPSDFQSDSDAIMSGIVVARFKSGDPRGAMVQGARALEERVISKGAQGDALALAAANVPPKIDDETIAASTHDIVMKVPDPRSLAEPIVDAAGVLRPIDRHDVAIATGQMSEGMSLLTVIVDDTAPLTAGLFAKGLAHRLGLNETNAPSGSAVLLVVVSGSATPSTAKTSKATRAKRAKVTPALEIVLGASLPKAALDVGSTMANWNERVIADPKTAGSQTGTAARAMSHLGMALAMHRAEQTRLAAELARKGAEWRAQLAAQQAQAQQQGVHDDGAFFDDDNPVAWGVGGAGLFGLFLAGREVLRRRPRSCKKCNVRMHRLAEELDDKHLQDGERAEERLGSVDYDIWACAQCGEVLKTRWGAIFTSYSRCRGCSWKTMTSTSRTIRAATTSSTGLAEVTEDCKHCSHHRTYTRVIPRVTKSSSSSSRSSSSGGGGGSSSGRGSSGSW